MDQFGPPPINVTLIGLNSRLTDEAQQYKFKFSDDENFYMLTAASLTNANGNGIGGMFSSKKYFTYQLTFTRDNNTITKNIPKTISSDTAIIELEQLKVPKMNRPQSIEELGGGKNNRKKYRKSRRKSKRTKKTAKRRR
jgi:hypothetical protein